MWYVQQPDFKLKSNMSRFNFKIFTVEHMENDEIWMIKMAEILKFIQIAWMYTFIINIIRISQWI